MKFIPEPQPNDGSREKREAIAWSAQKWRYLEMIKRRHILNSILKLVFLRETF